MLRFSLLVLAACDAGTQKLPPCVGLDQLEHAADWSGLEREAHACGDDRAEQLALAMQGQFHAAVQLDPLLPRIDRVALLVLDGELRGAARITPDPCMAELFTRIATPKDRRPEQNTCKQTTELLDSKTVLFLPQLVEPRPLRQRAHQFGAGEMISGLRSKDSLATLLADGLPIDCNEWNPDVCEPLVTARDHGDGRPLAKVVGQISAEHLALVAAYVHVGRAELARAIQQLPPTEPIDQFSTTIIHELDDRSELLSIYDLDHTDIDRRLARFKAAVADPEHLIAILALQYKSG